MKLIDFQRFFVGRKDAVGIYEGRPLSLPVRNGDWEKSLSDHLEGRRRCGLYNHLNGDVVRFAVIDFDSHGKTDPLYLATVADIARACRATLEEHGVNPFREVSKSGRGNYHLWLFFADPLPASFVRGVLLGFIGGLMARDFPEIADTLHPEVFPKQDSLDGGIGNFVWLPMFPPDVQEGRTVFLDDNENFTEPAFEFTPRNALDALAGEFDIRIEKLVQPGNGSDLYSELFGKRDVLEGQRHDTLTRVAGHLKAKKLPLDEALPILDAWNRALDSPLPAEEVERTVRSLFRDQSQAEGPKLLNGDDISSICIPPRVDLVSGLLRAKSLNFLAGEEGSGKSILAMNLALAIASGGDTFLSFEIAQRGKALYLNNELYPEDLFSRFQRMSQQIPGPLGLRDFLTPDTIFPSLDESFSWLVAKCREVRPVLVVLDCLYFSHSKDENDSSEMKVLIRQLQSIRDQHGTCVLVLHHLRKAGVSQQLTSSLMRGSGVFGAAADTVVMMRRSQTEDAKRVLKPTKLRHSADENRTPRLLGLDPTNLWFRDEGPVREEDHLVSDAGTAEARIIWEDVFGERDELSFREICTACEPYHISVKTIQRALEAALKAGELTRPRRGYYRLASSALDILDTASKHVQDVQKP